MSRPAIALFIKRKCRWLLVVPFIGFAIWNIADEWVDRWHRREGR